MENKLYRVVFLRNNADGIIDENLGFRLAKITDFDESLIEICDDFTYYETHHSRIDTFTEEEIMEINPKFMEFAEEVKD